MLTTLQYLERGLKRVRKGWCQEQYAKDGKGRLCPPNSPRAKRWCAVGALGKPVNGVPEDYLAAVETVHDGHVLLFNDTPNRKKSEIIALYRRAIAACKRDMKKKMRGAK